ncbi:MAG: malectin domain-containing carbohydrate-binding protein [Kiritimatiellae bacterium]|nr:malectin domain-containing carbohydrate-binding protein [Kiritimatiellia bacterium]
MATGSLAVTGARVGDAYVRGSADGQRWTIGTEAVEMRLEVRDGRFAMTGFLNKLAHPAVEYVDANEASHPLGWGASYVTDRYRFRQLWTKPLQTAASVDPADDRLQLTVKKGDRIGFAVNSGGDCLYDATEWVSIVAYDDGETYTSTNDHDVAQGPVWSYFLRKSGTRFMVALDDVVDGPRGKVRLPSARSGLRETLPEWLRDEYVHQAPYVGGTALHPGYYSEPVRVWTAPKDGTVSVRGPAKLTCLHPVGKADARIFAIDEVAAVAGPHPAPPCTLEKGEARQAVVGGRPAVQLDLTLKEASLEIVVHVVAFPGTSVLRQWTELRNAGKDAVSLERHEGLFALNLRSGDAGPFAAYWLTGANNNTATAGMLHREAVGASHSRELFGRLTYNLIPWVAVEREGGGGDGLFVATDHSGSWKLALDRTPNGPLHIGALIRLADLAPNTSLAAGASLELPTATIGVFHHDLDDMSARLYAWQYEYLWDYAHDDWFTLMPWTVETWYGDPNLQQQFAGRLAYSDAGAIDTLRECGMEVVWNDAGWSADQNIWADNREGPDYAESLRYCAKTGMKWCLWMHSNPTLGVLNGKAGAWGNFQWRTDTAPVYGNDGRRFRDKTIRFLERNPRCSWHTCSGGGTFAHTFDWQRYGDIHYDTDVFADYGNANFSYLDLPDKWFDNLTESGPTRRRMITMTPKYHFVPTAEETELLRRIADLYHYLLQAGVAGRWSLTAHPVVKGDAPHYYFQRLSFDRKRALIVISHDVKGEAILYPRGLLPKQSYLVEGGTGTPTVVTFKREHKLIGRPTAEREVMADAKFPATVRTGADLMANGILVKDQPAGVYIYLNLPDRPGSGRDAVAPAAPGRVLARRETNLGHTGVMLYWSPGADNNWISYYEVTRDGQSLGRTATGLAFFDRSAGWDTKASYAVRTVDGDGNTSAWTRASAIAGEPLTYAALGAHYPEAGRNGWRAETSTDGRAYQLMTWVRTPGPVAYEFGGGPNRPGGVEGFWEGLGTARCGRGWQQASASGMCVRAWEAPQTGVVRVTGKAVKEYRHRSGGGPLHVRIMHGEKQVWPANGWAVAPVNNLDGVNHDLTLNLAAGDVLRFVLDKGTGTNADILAWMPRIVYAETSERADGVSVVRILCGAKKPYADKTGNAWSADDFYTGGRAVKTKSAIEGALPTLEDAELYRHGRAGKRFTYSIPVTPGLYTVRLKFAETQFDYFFQRPFNLDINGRRVLRNVDTCQAARGPRRAHERVFRYVVPDGDGRIVLAFSGGWEPTMATDKAMVKAIEVLPEAKPHIRINAGSERAVVDWGGYVWEADRDFQEGTTIASDHALTQASPTLYDQVLYRTARMGKEFSYVFTASPGLYTVHLKFAELWLGEAGKRPMNVEVNGRRFLTSWDPATAAERTDMAADVRFEDIVPDGTGQITVRVSGAGANEAILQGLEIE